MVDVKKIYNDLKNGLVYSDGFCGFYKYKKFIRYNHFGSSSVKFTLKDLKWLIEKIFKNDISRLKIGDNLFVYA